MALESSARAMSRAGMSRGSYCSARLTGRNHVVCEPSSAVAGDAWRDRAGGAADGVSGFAANGKGEHEAR